MKIALIQPAMGRNADEYVRSWQMEPLSMATLASLTHDEHEVAFIDDRMEPINFNVAVDLVAITVETYTARRAYQIAARFRARGVPVVLGGYHVTLLPDEAALYGDSIVIGGAEETWPRLLRDWRSGCAQRVYRPRSLPPLEGLRPDRSIFAGKRYVPMSLVESGRGCPFLCDFCAVAAVSKTTYRRRPPQEVAAEIAEAPHRHLFFVDDNFTGDTEATKAFLREIAPLGVKWFSQASIQTAGDPELLELLERSGCFGLLLGFESLSEDTLRAMSKKFNRGVARYRDAIARLRDRGVKLYATFVFGYDTDAPDAFERTLEFAMEQKLFVAAFNHLQPFPGTPLYDRLQKEGRLLYDRWWLEPHYRFGQVAFRPRGMEPEELYERCMAIRREFYGIPSILRRATDLRANLKDVSTGWLHFGVNALLRHELRDKWQTPLGDTREPQPTPLPHAQAGQSSTAMGSGVGVLSQ